jgi:hypothetical protein
MNYSAIINYWDWLILPFYLISIYIIASRIKNKRIHANPIYTYFLWGLFAKVVGAISVCLIYVYYYKEGGDTLHYHSSAVAFLNLLLQNPVDFFSVYVGSPTNENYSYFNIETGFPSFFSQPYEASVAKLLVPFELIALKSYIVASALMAVVSYTGIWKLYSMFCEVYPKLYKQFAVAILFVPSVVFWGSGMLKDSWTIAACGWFCYSFYMVFITKKRMLYNTITLLIASCIFIFIKPYIFVALMPGCLIWGMWHQMLSIKHYVVRLLFMPVVFFIGIGGGLLLWNAVSSGLGQYSSIEGMIKKASDSSMDLKQEYYNGNSFDIGSYDATLGGVFSKFPIAVFTGLFRPFIWEAKNVVMVLSGIENFFILLFFLYVFFRSPLANSKNLFSDPIVLFTLIFALFFSFSVAISTSNFGALVRLRIPQMPFLISGLVILNYRDRTIHYHSS